MMEYSIFVVVQMLCHIASPHFAESLEKCVQVDHVGKLLQNEGERSNIHVNPRKPSTAISALSTPQSEVPHLVSKLILYVAQYRNNS